MIIKNNINRKELPISKENWDKFSKVKKANFSIVDLNDASDKDVQVVDNTAKKVAAVVETKKEEVVSGTGKNNKKK